MSTEQQSSPRRKWLILGLLLAILVLALTGKSLLGYLQENYLNPAQEIGQLSEEEAALDLEQATSYPVIITDSEGRNVEIPAKPERIISLGPNMTEFLWDLGAGARQVGRTSYCDYPEEVAEIEEIGTLRELDLEKIAELKPDLVLASTHVKEEALAAIEKLEIPVLVLYESKDYMGVAMIYHTLGEALDLHAVAAEKEDAFLETVAMVEKKVEGAKRPKAYYVVGFGEYGEYTAGGDTFIHGMMDLAGASNVAADLQGWSYSLEQLVEADPDVIILSDFDAENFGKTSPYDSLKAVKEGKLHVIDRNLLDRQGPRNLEGIVALAKIFHPERFD